MTFSLCCFSIVNSLLFWHNPTYFCFKHENNPQYCTNTHTLFRRSCWPQSWPELTCFQLLRRCCWRREWKEGRRSFQQIWCTWQEINIRITCAQNPMLLLHSIILCPSIQLNPNDSTPPTPPLYCILLTRFLYFCTFF